MTEETKTPARRCIEAACAEGLIVAVYTDGFCDYRGTDPAMAWEAITDTTEPATVRFFRPEGALTVVWQNDEDDFADCTVGGFADRWFAANKESIL